MQRELAAKEADFTRKLETVFSLCEHPLELRLSPLSFAFCDRAWCGGPEDDTVPASTELTENVANRLCLAR
jgi:hypothetical protein